MGSEMCIRDRAWPNSELQVIREAGHAASEPGITDALVRATGEMARRLLDLPPEEAWRACCRGCVVPESRSRVRW